MPFTVLIDGEPSEIDILVRKPRLVLRVNGRVYTVETPVTSTASTRTMRINGEAIPHATAHVGDAQFLRLHGRTFEARMASLAGAGTGAGGSADAIKAPMPGVVIRLHKQPGDAVARGDTLITIESMKLQMALPAPRDGVIAEFFAREGGGFDKDEVLARLVSIGEV